MKTFGTLIAILAASAAAAPTPDVKARCKFATQSNKLTARRAHTNR